MTKLATISPRQQCITEIHLEGVYTVPVLAGAPQLLVTEREYRGHHARKSGKGYHTNREIKYWSTFFLLKALTTSGTIQDWRGQRSMILTWLQMSERVFYRHLDALQQKGLLTIDEDFTIRLADNRQAADIMGLYYAGLIHIPYNPFKNAGKQIFQYFLRVEEIRHNQQSQLDALIYHLDNNPPLRNLLILHLVHAGADGQRLYKDKKYLQERLLALQKAAFRHGSDILREIFHHRADVNRSVRCIKEHHTYLSKSSVSYMKKCLFKRKLVAVQKVCIHSKVRARLYVPDPAAPGGRRDGYKYLRRKGNTALFLTDQITPLYSPLNAKERFHVEKKAA